MRSSSGELSSESRSFENRDEKNDLTLSQYTRIIIKPAAMLPISNWRNMLPVPGSKYAWASLNNKRTPNKAKKSILKTVFMAIFQKLDSIS